MINNLTGGAGLTVTGGGSVMPYIPQNTSNPLIGMMRISNSSMEVFNGSSWQVLPSSFTTVSLDQEIQDLLRWAKEQRKIEQDRADLVNKNPALKKAYDAVIRAEENFELLSKFVEVQEEPGIVVGYNFNTP